MLINIKHKLFLFIAIDISLLNYYYTVVLRKKVQNLARKPTLPIGNDDEK